MTLWFNVCHLQLLAQSIQNSIPLFTVYHQWCLCLSQLSPVISVRSGEWAGNVSDGPGWGSEGPHVWLCLQSSRDVIHCVSTDTGWWVGSHIQRGKKNASSPHEEGEYEAFVGGNFLLKLVFDFNMAFILFHFLAVSVYDEGWLVCNITLSLYHYREGSLNTDTQQSGGINTKHKRGIGFFWLVYLFVVLLHV